MDLVLLDPNFILAMMDRAYTVTVPPIAGEVTEGFDPAKDRNGPARMNSRTSIRDGFHQIPDIEERKIAKIVSRNERRVCG